MTAKFGDLAADVGASPFGLGLICGRVPPEPVLDVGVPEADDGVFAGEDSFEQAQVLGIDGVEAWVPSASVAAGAAEPFKGDDAGLVIGGGVESVKVASVRSPAYLVGALR